MRYRALVAVAAALLATCWPTAPANAQTSSTASSSVSSTATTVNPSATGIIPQPDSGAPPEDPGDRGGWAQLIALVVTVGGLATIGLLAARSARRARAATGNR